MTVQEAIEKADGLRPNDFSAAEKNSFSGSARYSDIGFSCLAGSVYDTTHDGKCYFPVWLISGEKLFQPLAERNKIYFCPAAGRTGDYVYIASVIE